MNPPDYHPHADDLAEFLVATFGRSAPSCLVALQSLLGNTEVMQFLEAFSFFHQSVEAADQKTENKREGMRLQVLHIHAARSLSEVTILELLNSTGASHA